MDDRKNQASHVAVANAAEGGSKDHVQSQTNDIGRRLLQLFKESQKNIIKFVLIGWMIGRPIDVWIYQNGEGLMSKVPYAADFGIIACSLAWNWRHASVWAFRTRASLVVSYSLMVIYKYYYAPGSMARVRATTFFFAITLLCFDLLGWFASRVQRAARSQQWQDEENGREAECPKKGSGKSTAVVPGSEYRARNRGTRPNVSAGKSLASRLAFALLVLVNIATLILHPPTALSNYIADSGCSVRIEDVHNDLAHLRFTAQARNSSIFVGPGCSFDRQMSVIQRQMNKHAKEVISADTASAAISTGSCTVYCFRRDSGNLIGTISQTLDAGVLPDMSFCRGQHGFFGDCEAVGEKLGYDTTKEGWLNDVR